MLIPRLVVAEQQEVFHARTDRGTSQQQRDHHRLRADDPDPPPSHGEECVAVHDEAVDQLQRPGKRGEGADAARSPNAGTRPPIGTRPQSSAPA
jgi:hypothetical protein